MHTNYSHSDSPTGLIKQAAEGDVYSFKLLVDEFSGYAFSLAYKTLFNKDDAKDIVQESFVRVWKHLKNYKPEIKFTTWLYKIVINLCYDKIKTEKRRNLVIENYDADIMESLSSQSLNMEEVISNKDLVRVIEQLSNGLTYKQRMVFVLRDLQNLNIEEVSEVLNISSGAVKTNLFHARKFIAEKLSRIEKEVKAK
jgi:RNA polymerase sigma-70 factor, ECF subfamily